MGGRKIRLWCESQYKELLGEHEKRLKQRKMGWGREGRFLFSALFAPGRRDVACLQKGEGDSFSSYNVHNKTPLPSLHLSPSAWAYVGAFAVPHVARVEGERKKEKYVKAQGKEAPPVPFLRTRSPSSPPPSSELTDWQWEKVRYLNA